MKSATDSVPAGAAENYFLTKTSHREYISSSYWQQRRREYLENHDSCVRCRMPRWLAEIAYDQDLNVHHVSYANKGCEQDEDLESLCRRCHEIEKFGRSNMREPKATICEQCHIKHWNPYDSKCDYCSRTVAEVSCCQCNCYFTPNDNFLVCDFCHDIRLGNVERIFVSFDQLVVGLKAVSVGEFMLLNTCTYYGGVDSVRDMLDKMDDLVSSLLAKKIKDLEG